MLLAFFHFLLIPATYYEVPYLWSHDVSGCLQGDVLASPRSLLPEMVNDFDKHLAKRLAQKKNQRNKIGNWRNMLM